MSGTVVYTITDDNGCTADISVTISDPSTWYDLNWQYRRPVTVTNPGGITLMDFQVLVTLDNTFDFSKAEADGSDILVTDIDKTTTYSFLDRNLGSGRTNGGYLGKNAYYPNSRNNHIYLLRQC